MQPIQDISSTVPNLPPEVKGIGHLSQADKIKLWQSAQGLESTFTVFLMKDLKLGPAQDNGQQSFAADTFGDMFKQAIADQMSKGDSTGLAEQIYRDSALTAEKSMAGSVSLSGKHPGTLPLSGESKMPSLPVPVVPKSSLFSNPVTPHLPYLSPTTES